MHPNQGAADIQAADRPDMLHRDRVIKPLPCRCGKGAARLGLRQDIDRLIAVFFGRLPFDNQRAVEMLAALRGEIQPVIP